VSSALGWQDADPPFCKFRSRHRERLLVKTIAGWAAGQLKTIGSLEVVGVVGLAVAVGWFLFL